MDGDANLKQSQDSVEAQSGGDASRSKDPLIGTTLDGRFYVEEVLGTGGMSVVYKAKQLRVNRYVAIKTLIMRLDTKPVYRERFQREIQSLCSLNHPHIVTVYDCLIGDDDHPYVIMDFLRGRSLEALIEEDGPLSLDRFARIAVQVCSALEHAHRNGIVHRDLKPGNVVLLDEENDFVKVVDFGLAKIGEDSRKLTKSGELWGSPPYMSPEQCMGKEVDARSDVYSLGAVMYEMLTGKDPFHEAVTVFELIQQHVGAPPPPCFVTNPNVVVPPSVEEVIQKAMAKDPADRYQTAGELRNALVRACTGNAGVSGDLLLRMPSSPETSGSFALQEPDLYGGSGSAPGAKYFDFAMNPLGSAEFESVGSNNEFSGSTPAGNLDDAAVAASLMAVVSPTVPTGQGGQDPWSKSADQASQIQMPAQTPAPSAQPPRMPTTQAPLVDGTQADLEQLNQLRKPTRQMDSPSSAQPPSRLRQSLDVPPSANMVTIPVIIAIFCIAAAGAYFGVTFLGGKQEQKPPVETAPVVAAPPATETKPKQPEGDDDSDKDAAAKATKRVRPKNIAHRREDPPKHRTQPKPATAVAPPVKKKSDGGKGGTPWADLLNAKDPPKKGKN